MGDSYVKPFLAGLEKLSQATGRLKNGSHVVQVGIFGHKDSRRRASVTNTELGFVHEFGSISRGIPARPFMVRPLKQRQEQLRKATAGDLLTLFKTGQTKLYLRRIGQAAVNIVTEAFDTSGWGSWPPLALSTLMGRLKGNLVSRKQKAAEVLYEGAGHAKPLINTGQLRRSIAYRVVS